MELSVGLRAAAAAREAREWCSTILGEGSISHAHANEIMATIGPNIAETIEELPLPAPGAPASPWRGMESAPKTGEEISIPAKKVPHFAAAKAALRASGVRPLGLGTLRTRGSAAANSSAICWVRSVLGPIAMTISRAPG